MTGQAMIDIGFQAVPKATKVGMLAGTYAFPQSHLAEIKPQLERRGGVEVVVEQFDAAASDYTAQLISFARHRVQAGADPGQFHGGRLCHQASAGEGPDGCDVRARRLGRQQRDHPAHRGGQHPESMGLFQCPVFPHQDDPPIANYRRILIEKIGTLPQGRPNIYDLIGYGSTYVLAEVLKKAGRDLSMATTHRNLGDDERCQALGLGRL